MKRSLRIPTWLSIVVALSMVGWSSPPTGVAVAAGAPRLAQAHQTMSLLNASPATTSQTQPLYFEPNRGQFGSHVHFVTRAAGYLVSFTGSGADFSLHAPSAPMVGIGLHLVGANPHPTITGRKRLASIVNYYLGNDPSRWQVGVPTYAQVVYHHVYPHTDLVFYHRRGHLEYDWVLHPGADPRRITLAISGSAAPRIDGAGTLTSLSHGAALTQRAPRIYQWAAGVRRVVGGRYVLTGRDQVRIELGAYDHSRSLVIDPIVDYSTRINGQGFDYAVAIAVDHSNGVYITGDTSASSLPAQTNCCKTTYVSKLDAGTGAILWSTYVGGSNHEHVYALAVDNAGSVYEGGSTASSDFPLSNNTCILFYGDCTAAFLAKLDSATGALTRSTYVGGHNNDTIKGMTVSSTGTVYATGETHSPDFRGAINPCPGICDQGFVASLNSPDLSLRYAEYVGGSTHNSGNGIALDESGTGYITGSTDSSDLPKATNKCNTQCPAYYAFATAFNVATGALLWSTYVGGTDGKNGVYGNGIATHAGSVYIVGDTQNSSLPAATNSCTNTNPNTNNSCADAFVTGLNASTGSVTFSTFVGGTNLDLGHGILADDAGIFLVGYAEGAILPAQTNSCTVYQNTGACTYSDAFVSRVDGATGQVLASTFLGGSLSDEGFGIAVDQNGQLYIAGNTSSTDLPNQTNSCGTNCYAAAFMMRLSLASVENTGTTNDPTQSALATTGGTGPGTPGSLTATASGGTGKVTVAIYDTNPVNAPPFANAGGYIDVRVSAGNTFTQVQIQDCTPANGRQLFWFDGNTWSTVGNQTFDPKSGCVSATIDAGSAPSIAQLTGTVFATGTSSAPTAARVSRFSAHHAAGAVTFRWRVVSNADITGFNLLSGRHRLNARVIAVHPSRGYRYQSHWSGAGRYSLQVLLRSGRTVMIPAR